MHSFNMSFAQAQTHNDNRVWLWVGFIEALHRYWDTPICTRIQIPKDRLAIFTNYSSVTKDQALNETILTLFHPVVHGCFQLISVKIQSPVMMLSKANSQKYIGLEGLVHTKINYNQAIPIWFTTKSNILPVLFIHC